ncbi:maleylpyruvate isomerase N-terminal domain-containing protein [Streptomyces rubradiris]|uniref:Maleylpyruvate isomerase n=1 Tax=Streptomyces rubradiris TaxID=285531 RepID=A0ABQ3RBM7_STRRR|nr:maleylpyruvate isomerase N-terminal domain-containing protein [Streptomyces rubradiris]GHH27989.1 maleylpyruvate isomerase [Streptomyces rubradiris]GHI53222.1 maleylpyruvate isomerase [Streptomyces rubradiris]
MTTEFTSCPARTLRAAYEAASAVVAGLGDEESWQPTGCTGWAVRDLVFHCAGDAQRALVALHTPTEEPADRDWVTYWRGWLPDTAGAANGRRWARVNGSMFLDFGQLKGLYLETLAAVVHAAGEADPARRVVTQGHVLTAGDLITTLAVEATVHHLDLTVALPHAPGPSPEGLAAVRATLDGLLGRPGLPQWSDAHYARVGTGRAALTDAERAALGPAAGRFPLFG